MGILKNLRAAKTAFSKSRADELAELSKKAKVAAEEADKLKTKQTYFTKGVKTGEKKGAKKVVRKAAATAGAAGAIYYEGKTGNISSAIKNANKAVLEQKKRAAQAKAKDAAKKEVSKVTKKVVKSSAPGIKKK
jgi:hypothetical protein